MNEVEEICDAVRRPSIVGKVVFSGTMDELRGRAPASIHALRTSNDAGALLLASGQDDVQVVPSVEGEGLEVSAEAPGSRRLRDRAGHAGIAIRRLEQRASSLESLFLQLTADGGSAGASRVRSRTAQKRLGHEKRCDDPRRARGRRCGMRQGPRSAEGTRCARAVRSQSFRICRRDARAERNARGTRSAGRSRSQGSRRRW